MIQSSTKPTSSCLCMIQLIWCPLTTLTQKTLRKWMTNSPARWSSRTHPEIWSNGRTLLVNRRKTENRIWKHYEVCSPASKWWAETTRTFDLRGQTVHLPGNQSCYCLPMQLLIFRGSSQEFQNKPICSKWWRPLPSLCSTWRATSSQATTGQFSRW